MLTVADVKAHSRIDTDSEDAYIQTLLDAAYKYAENYTGRIILPVTETYNLDDFEPVITLPKAPVSSVISVEYYDTDDVLQSFTEYYLDLREVEATIQPVTDVDWPDTNQEPENVVITYGVGYSAIPADIDQAVKLIFGTMYEQRENHIVGVPINKVTLRAEDQLLNAYRIHAV
jgi:uncharacterized phiE125 gp8 family phage protein